MSHGEERFTLSEGSAGEEFGPYVVYERLGVGGMATVHRAKKRGLAGFERGVALKRMLPNLSQDAEFINSFVREAKLASLLTHPNIAQIYDFGQIGNVYFIAMEHVEGLDVTKLLRYSHRHDARPPLNVVLSILCELCEALEYAHTFVDENGQRQCIVHRDVSPSNMIVAQTGHLKVIDFGIAKASSRPHHTESGRVKGKLGYMAPEALDGRPIGPPSDVFSAGVVAYELLTADRLFHAKSDYELLRRAREAEIPPPSRRNPSVPPSLDRVVLSALERDERRRLQTAGELRKALEQVAIEAGVRSSSSDVTAWWAKAATTAEHPDARELPPVSLASAAQRRSAPPVPSRPRTRMYSPSSVELSGGQHEEGLADRSAHRMGAGSLAEPLRGSPRTACDAQPRLPLGSVDGLPGERPLPVGSIRPSPPAPARSRSRALFVTALGLCAVAAGLAAYQFAVRPKAAVAPTLAVAPPSPSRPALVKFIVRPADAVVEIGGKEVARHSPVEISLERGVYTVAVSHSGSKRWTSQITLHDGESQTVNVALEPATAVIRLSSEPTGLVAQLDGKLLDQVTPAEFEISPGPHRLVVVGATRTWAQDFVAATDGTYAFHAALPTAKRAPAAAVSSIARTTPPASERTSQRASSSNAARLPAVREPVVEPEDRVIEASVAAPVVKPLAKVESPFLPIPQPDPAVVSTPPPPQPAVRLSAPPLVPASTNAAHIARFLDEDFVGSLRA